MSAPLPARPAALDRHAALAPALVMAGMVVQNLGAAWAKHLFPLVGAEGVTALRVGMSSLLLLLAVRPWRQRLAARDCANLAIYGGMLGCMNLLIYRAFNLIPIGVAVAIEVTGPLVLVLLHSRRAADFAWVGCAAAGLALLLPWWPAQFPHQALAPVGVAYAIGAAFCWAMYIVFGKRVSLLPGGQAVAWGMLAAALLTVPIGVAHAGVKLLAPQVLLGGLLVALLSSTLPYTLEMIALRRLPRRVFGVLVSSAPAVGALAGWAVLGERLLPIQWLAVLLVMAALAGSAATA
ncbi:DMT family transporter [Massilia sp. 9096]|uniref:EamA family transporter n=1 Tax=Massilia sp. 9096 TaxID=1500894 RepID=UPI000691B692|nr:EamA family transporter [Massilia sp. 9096]